MSAKRNEESKPSIDKDRRIPYYQQCAAFILKSIQEGRYSIGEFLPPERELSREFGVNRLTLRKGLADLLRKGILESVPGAGNRVVMKQGKAEKARLVGCVMNRTVGVRTLSPYYADIFSGIEAGVTDLGFNLVFSSVKADDIWAADGTTRISPQALNTRVAGALLVGGLPDELAVAYQKKGIPVVLVDKVTGHKDISSVVPDNKAGGLLAGRYLAGLGHKRIAFLGAADDPVVAARLDGLLRAIKDAGRSFSQKDRIEGGYEIRPAYNAMRDFLARNRKSLPTAVFAVNDEAAIGALKAIQEAGLSIPRDISLVGFDDITWSAHTVPPLTTVRVPREEIGRLAARVLISQIEANGLSATSTVLSTELVVRESCGAPRA